MCPNGCRKSVSSVDGHLQFWLCLPRGLSRKGLDASTSVHERNSLPLFETGPSTLVPFGLELNAGIMRPLMPHTLKPDF